MKPAKIKIKVNNFKKSLIPQRQHIQIGNRLSWAVAYYLVISGRICLPLNLFNFYLTFIFLYASSLLFYKHAGRLFAYWANKIIRQRSLVYIPTYRTFPLFSCACSCCFLWFYITVIICIAHWLFLREYLRIGQLTQKQCVGPTIHFVHNFS